MLAGLAELDLPAEVGDGVGQPSRSARGGAALEQCPHQPALGGLVEVADHGALGPDLVEHADGGHLASQAGVGAPESCVGRGAQVDDETGAGGLAHGPVEVRAPVRGDHAEPGEVDPAAESVRRDPVAGAHQPEHRRDDRQPPGRPTTGGRIQRREVERLVEHTRVDRVGASRWRVEQVRVASYVVGLGGSEPEHLHGPVGIGAAQLGQRVEHLLASRRELGGAEPGEIQSGSAARRGLALGRGKQDQHGATLGWLGGRRGGAGG